LLSRRLLTNVQVNNITTLYDTHGHTYIHHIGISIILPFYTSSTLLGRPAGPDPSHLTQEFLHEFYRKLLVLDEDEAQGFHCKKYGGVKERDNRAVVPKLSNNDSLQKLVASMSQRLATVIQKEGWNTHY
jgi:hypothetical protein